MARPTPANNAAQNNAAQNDASQAANDFWQKCGDFQKQAFDDWQEAFNKFSSKNDSFAQWNEWQDAFKGINWFTLANQWSNPNSFAEKSKAWGEFQSQAWKSLSDSHQEWAQKFSQSGQDAAEKCKNAYQGNFWSADPQASANNCLNANLAAFQAVKDSAQQQAEMFSEVQSAYMDFMKKVFETATNPTTPA